MPRTFGQDRRGDRSEAAREQQHERPWGSKAAKQGNMTVLLPWLDELHVSG